MGNEIPFTVLSGIHMIGVLSSIVSHADEFSLMLAEMLDTHCPRCGYRYDHPIVRHETGYKGLECGWR